MDVVLHTAELGVCKQLTNLWLGAINRDNDCHISKPHRRQMNIHVTGIKIAQTLSRTSRSLYERARLIPSEWRIFLLFFFAVILESFLSLKYYNQILLFSGAIYYLYENQTYMGTLLQVI